MEHDYLVQMVEYLNASPASSAEGETIVITIRPEPESFRPHNIGLLRPQAERLLKDLQRALARLGPLLLFSLIAAAGCSSSVHVSSSTHPHATGSVDTVETEVALEMLTDQEEPLDSSPPEVLPAPPLGTDKAVEVNGNRNVVIAVDGDLHVHQHMHLAHRQHEERSELVRKKHEPVEIGAQRPKTTQRCERLLMEHEEVVARWRARMGMGPQFPLHRRGKTMIRLLGKVVFGIGWTVGWLKWHLRAPARAREVRCNNR